MNVGELKASLSTMDDDRLVVMSKDAEGNDYSPLSCIDDTCVYKAECTWAGSIGLEKLTDQAIRDGYTEEDIISDGVPALVL